MPKKLERHKPSKPVPRVGSHWRDKLTKSVYYVMKVEEDIVSAHRVGAPRHSTFTLDNWRNFMEPHTEAQANQHTRRTP